MKRKTLKVKMTILGLSIIILFQSCNLKKDNSSNNTYKETWSSLSTHNTPAWLLDMKFGIYSHWGPLSVIANQEKDKQQSYIEVLNTWKGEKFNPTEWAKMYKGAGAQFAGMIAMHGSGCVHWDSDITDWNLTNHGIKKDVFGSLIKAVRKEGMKTIGTFHAIQPYGIWGRESKNNATYHNPVKLSDRVKYNEEHYYDGHWMQGWFERVQETYEKYDLDLVWFDTSFGGSVGAELNGIIKNGKYNYNGTKKSKFGGISETYQKKLIADYYNYNNKKGKDVDIIYKTNDIPVNVGMRDIENGNLNGLQYDPWMADINIMQHKYSWTWFYYPKNPLKDANCIVDMLIDITSKNGRILLNVPPKADGSFAPIIKKEMEDIGNWLKINGEGIYGTTPWTIYGEGPTDIINPGQHGQGKKAGALMPKYTYKDIRYTCKNNCIYVFSLAEPKDDTMHMHALGNHMKLYPNEIKNITLLGNKSKIKYKQTENDLIVTLPKNRKKQYAYCLKIEIK